MKINTRIYRMYICLFLYMCIISLGKAQELNLDIKVNVQGNVTSDTKIFQNLERSIIELMNTTKWTEDGYEDYERIKGQLQLIITEESAPGLFKAELIVKADRPVFNSNYTTSTLSLIDNSVNFRYDGVQPVLKTNSNFFDNLSSVLSYYAYVIIGIDKDTFSSLGGDSEFRLAFEIINTLAPNFRDDPGWDNKSGNRRNRYWLIENIQSPTLRPVRQAIYEYHRVCLDKMMEDVEKGRAIMLSALTSIGQANLEYPNAMLLQLFGDAKYEEITEIYRVADKGQKTKVRAIMVGLDKTKTEKYRVLEQ
jgi:hypothetical protein